MAQTNRVMASHEALHSEVLGIAARPTPQTGGSPSGVQHASKNVKMVFGEGDYKSEWRDWARRTRVYLRCILNDPKIEEQLTKVEAQRTECTPEQIRHLAWPEAHSIFIQTQLSLNLRGVPETRVAAAADKHGMEQ